MNQKELLQSVIDHALDGPLRVVRVWVLSRQLGKLHMAETVVMLRELLPAPLDLSYVNLHIQLQNGSEIRFALINEADRYRGQKTSLEVVLLEGLVDEIIRPALFDTGGKVLVEGVES